MADKWQLVFNLRSGKSYYINPIPRDGENTEQAASRMLDGFHAHEKEGQAWYQLVNADNKSNCFIRIADVTHAHTSKVDEEEEERNKARRAKNDELLDRQVNYYKEISGGDSWKKGKQPWESDDDD